MKHEITSQSDTQYTDEIICPHCGHAEPGSDYQIDARDDGDEFTATCPHCDKEFTGTLHVKYKYSTHRPPCPAGEHDYQHDHSWLYGAKNYTLYICKKCHDETYAIATHVPGEPPRQLPLNKEQL